MHIFSSEAPPTTKQKASGARLFLSRKRAETETFAAHVVGALFTRSVQSGVF
jgi:hypothetical protein